MPDMSHELNEPPINDEDTRPNFPTVIQTPGRVEGLEGEQWAQWLIPGGKNDPDFTAAPEILKKRIRLIAKTGDSIASADYLYRHHAAIEEMLLDGRLTDNQAAVWIARIEERHKKLKEAKEGSKVREEYSHDEYSQFLVMERWATDEAPKIDEKTSNQPLFFQEFSDNEKKIHKIRREIIRAAYYKRGATGETLDTLGKNEALAGISKTEMKALYNEMPGVKEGMRHYAILIDNATTIEISPGREITIFECKDKEEVEFFRANIAQETYNELVRNGRTPEEAEREAMEAEQVVFNLFYLGNTFESFDSKWENIAQETYNELVRNGRTPEEAEREAKKINPLIFIRKRGPKMVVEELGQASIRSAMKPLDSLIETTYRLESGLREAGNLGLWAYTQTQESINKDGKLKETIVKRAIARKTVYDRVETLPETSNNQNRFWTVQKQGDIVTIYVPECYPIQIIKSAWEQTQVKDPAGKLVPIWNYMKNPVGEIPWDAPEIQSIWKDYLGYVQKAGGFSEFVTGRKPINLSEFGGAGKWLNELYGVLGKFNLRTSMNLRRWILYASHGVLVDKRAPHIRIDKPGKRILKGIFGNIGMNYLEDKEFYFPWDQTGFNLF